GTIWGASQSRWVRLDIGVMTPPFVFRPLPQLLPPVIFAPFDSAFMVGGEWIVNHEWLGCSPHLGCLHTFIFF
ncbi:MAG: hypothetical protein WAT12_14205, partial [Candidatus Nitrotoga sp.]